MKKLLALLMLLCLLPLCVAAETNSDGNLVVRLDGVEFFFTPIEGYCFTRTSSASEFGRLGLSQREVLRWMEYGSYHVLMFDKALSCQVAIYASPTDAPDYDDMTEYGEESECAYYASLLADYGYEVAAVEMYVVPGGHKFVWTNASQTLEDGTVQHMSEYMTCKGGVDIRIIVLPMEGEVTDELLAMGDAIAESMWITADRYSLDATGN